MHARSLFTPNGELHSIREDVGRHNALDKLLGKAFLQDAVPLRSHLLLLSGRASFELLQRAVMGGIPMVATIGTAVGPRYRSRSRVFHYLCGIAAARLFQHLLRSKAHVGAQWRAILLFGGMR